MSPEPRNPHKLDEEEIIGIIVVAIAAILLGLILNRVAPEE